MYTVTDLPNNETLQTSSLGIAIDVVQGYILTDGYFDDLGSKELKHAALEWIIEE
jgi:hypothetical protein